METSSAQMQGRIGLIAGAGEIPVYFARKAVESGLRLVSIAFSNDTDEHLRPFVEKNYCIGIWKSEKIFQTLKRENVDHLLMLGKVDKRIIFKPQIPDLRAIKFLKRLATHEDKTVLDGVIRELEQEGITVLSQRDYLKELFPKKGLLTRHRPSTHEMEDVEYGFSIARKMADLEIGQIKLHAPRLNFRQVENIIDKRQQMLARLGDFTQIIRRALIAVIFGFFQQQIGIAKNTIKRRA